MSKNTPLRLLCLTALCAGCSAAGASGDPSAGTNGAGAASSTGPNGGSAASSATGGPGGLLLSGVDGGSGTGAGLSCGTPSATQACCNDQGTQVCSGGEFHVWGPCVGPNTTVIQRCTGTEKLPPPPPPPLTPPPALCASDTVNNEPEILAGYSPATGQSVGQAGQIKVWVNDEHPPYIAPNEQVDPNTGAITAPGDRTAKAADGYLWEPALYIAPQTAEAGGTPHFPQVIKGWYNNTPAPTGGTRPRGAAGGIQGVPIDPVPAGTNLPEQYTGEDIWDVSALGLAPGTYMGEFVIHDGDRDRAVGCITIVITP